MRSLNRFFRSLATLAVAVLTVGCPDDTPTTPGSDLNSLLVTPVERSVLVGSTAILRVKALTNSFNAFDLDSDWEVAWTSSDPAIATLSGGDRIGVTVHGVAPGKVTITASSNGLTGTAQVTITTPGLADGLVFSSTRSGNSEIYILEQETARNLTQNSATDITPAKHGDRIYFSSNRDGNFEIYSMKLDGSEVVRITNNPLADRSPSVSVNGTIAFAREVSPGREQIFTMDLQGKNETNISKNNFQDANPVWGPSGTILAFVSDRNALYGPGTYLEIYSMNADGSDVKRLTHNDKGIDYHPTWSPNGQYIIFTSNRPENPKNPQDETCYFEALEVWIMFSDGSNPRNLTDHCRGDAYPAISPDGTELVFVSDRGSATDYAWDLWKMPIVGGPATRITKTGKEASPVWR